MALLRPRRLAPGQTIGMVAPSSAPNEPERIRFAIDTVESLGFKVKPGAHLYDRDGYLAGADAARAADLNAMFADEGVDAIWCVRGGYGASRILPALDYALMQRRPKALIGYSDITALHMAIHRHAGLVTFHGPVALRAFTPYSLGELKRVLWTGETPTRLGGPPPFERAEGRVDWDNRVATLVPGRARGRLLGGNLCLLAHLCGTPYFPDLRGAILFLEDVEEAYYRIDRMLTQLWLSGALAGIAGVAFGKFTNCDPSPFFLQNRPIEDILGERCRALGVPAVSGIMVGHIEDQTTLPVGCLAELDADAGTLTLLEPGVS
ncbi:MAG TPA: LD-carboxypeptidase [Candidatus Deferrimicrobiaceae bacterium]|nr:LD-carboxypeptidase [Candidatus Deferrimicrobiaceae bacterium]